MPPIRRTVAYRLAARLAAEVRQDEIAQHELSASVWLRPRVPWPVQYLMDDRLDAHLALGHMHRAISELERGHFWDVLVLGDEHLVLGEVAEREAVVKR